MTLERLSREYMPRFIDKLVQKHLVKRKLKITSAEYGKHGYNHTIVNLFHIDDGIYQCTLK